MFSMRIVFVIYTLSYQVFAYAYIYPNREVIGLKYFSDWSNWFVMVYFGMFLVENLIQF